MKKIRTFVAVMMAVGLMLAIALPVAAQPPGPSIDPASIDEVIVPGSSLTVIKTVQTPIVPPKPDILFLADTTGSMGGAIASVQANASAIMTAVLASAPDAQFGVANYKDYPYDPYVVQWQQAMTSDTTAVQTAINTWAASGGADGSEGWFMALDRAANPFAGPPFGNPGWRDGSSRIIVIFGDAPAHDPVPMALTGLSYDVTEATVTADLQARGIKLVAVSLNTGFYPAGLDDDPLANNMDYPAVPPQTGTPGQASRIAAATGGLYLFAPTPEDVAGQILAGLTSLDITVSMTSDAAAPISTTFVPASVTVPSGSVVTFTETISVAADAPGGVYTASDWVLIDGEPMVDASGAIIYETKTIRVPDRWLTGGGQITTGNKKTDYRVSFAGPVGYMPDGGLVGQYQMNLHNVSVDALDGARFHSTEILVFSAWNDGGDGPTPPPAYANVAYFAADGRLNGEEGYTLYAQVADRGEPGKNDSINFALWYGGAPIYSSTWDFPANSNADATVTTKLDGGNLQIHSEVSEAPMVPVSIG